MRHYLSATRMTVPRLTTPQSHGFVLNYAQQLQALEPRAGAGTEIPRAIIRTPMYKANDSSDNYLMEYISPSHMLQRKLAEGRSRQASQIFMMPPKSMNIRHRTPNLPKFSKQEAGSREFDPSSRNSLTASSANGSARPKSALTSKPFAKDHHREVLVTRSPEKRHNPTKFGECPLTSFSFEFQIQGSVRRRSHVHCRGV